MLCWTYVWSNTCLTIIICASLQDWATENNAQQLQRENVTKIYLYVTQSAAKNAEVRGFLLINIWYVFLQRLKTLFEVRSPKGKRERKKTTKRFKTDCLWENSACIISDKDSNTACLRRHLWFLYELRKCSDPWAETFLYKNLRVCSGQDMKKAVLLNSWGVNTDCNRKHTLIGLTCSSQVYYAPLWSPPCKHKIKD